MSRLDEIYTRSSKPAKIQVRPPVGTIPTPLPQRYNTPNPFMPLPRLSHVAIFLACAPCALAQQYLCINLFQMIISHYANAFP